MEPNKMKQKRRKYLYAAAALGMTFLFELERMQPPVHELSGDSRNGSNRGQYRAGGCPR